MWQRTSLLVASHDPFMALHQERCMRLHACCKFGVMGQEPPTVHPPPRSDPFLNHIHPALPGSWCRTATAVLGLQVGAGVRQAHRPVHRGCVRLPVAV